MDEFDLIKKFFSKISKKNISALNLNDDVFFDKKKKLAISIDTYNEGYHFLKGDKLGLILKKIIRSSISDLICKGVQPKYYFISASGNERSFSEKNLKTIFKSLKQEEKKFGISLSGGDTTYSNKLSFTISSIGYTKKIVYRNKSKLNDDIYVTGNLGDSFIGLQILKKKISFKNNINNYFKDKYYHPDIPIKITKKLLNFANSSIDISDGLISDLEKMINNQNLSFHIDLEKIPISSYLSNVVRYHNLNLANLISNGDDYQTLFTASSDKFRIIKKISKKSSVKITKIGTIVPGKNKSSIFNQKGKQILIKSKGYIHNF